MNAPLQTVEKPKQAVASRPGTNRVLQRKCACGGTSGPSGECAECRRKRTLGLQTKLAVNQPGDRYEQEADRVAAQVMRMPAAATAPPVPIQSLAPGALQRQDGEEEAPDPITEGLGTVGENLGENNPEFTALVERLADDFLRQPAALSVGVPVFLGTNYAFLWGMALANPAMRRHLDDFNFGTIPGIIPQFPIKTFTYRILDEEQTRFEFDLGLDVSALMEAFNEGVFNTRISTLSLETSGGLDTGAASPVSLSELQVNLGLFDDGLMLSGGFRNGIPPYPLFERDDLTGESLRIMEQVPALPDLYPEQQDVRFLLQVDFVRLYHHFNPGAPPIRSVPPEVEGDRPLHRAATAVGPATAPPVVDAVLQTPGHALDTGTRQFMEHRFGHDFRHVRIHADDQAATSAQAVAARAYTVGSDVVFGRGEYAPGTDAGRHLLAHELTHVVQQGSAPTMLQREVVVDKPADLIPNPGCKGVSQTNADTIRGYLGTLCVDGSPTVDGTSGAVDIAGSFCFEPVQQIGHEGFATGPAPLEASRTRAGCSCLCDLVHSTRHLWTIRVDDVSRPRTVFDDTDAARGLKPGGTGGTVTTISPNSPAVFGSVGVSGKRIDYDPWLILGHELCGHGWLGSFGLAESKATFKNVGRQADTVDRENALRAEHGIEARGRSYRNPFCGESYERLKTDAPGKETLAFVDLCKQKRARCKKPGGGAYKLEETIPDTVACP